jgi:phosphate transport system permease protein
MALPATLRRPRRISSRTEDLVFQGAVALLGVAVLGLAVGIGLSLAGEAGPALGRFGPGFFARSVWDPVREDFGALPHIYGTLVTSLLALLIGGPVALGTAIFLAEFAPGWLRNPVSYLVELLAAVPSVVYGLWGLFVLAPLLRTTVQPALGNWLGFLPLFQGPYYGVGVFTGGLIVAIMVIPTIAAVSRDVIRAVPDDQREAMLALGATRWETVRHAVLPAARSGIVGAALLGLGRALGETMAVTMVIGNRPEIPASLFGPGYTMAAVIANEFAEATSDLHLSALFAVGFGLFVLTLLVNIAARVLVWRVAWGPVGGE